MRILILGGTRFHGKQVASLLITSGHEVVILSRRYASFPESVVQICKDRSAGLMELTGERFDVVLDFICHSGEEPAEVARSIGFGVCVSMQISSNFLNSVINPFSIVFIDERSQPRHRR
mgnify:CR=1 FL=1